MKKFRVKVQQLPHGHVTTEGAFYATVNGSNIGENGRAFWATHADALACGNRFAAQARRVERERQEGVGA